MEVLMRDLYCYECSLQFDTKYVFDFHLSVVHGLELNIKQESDSEASDIIEIKTPDEEINWEKKSKGRKVSIKTGPDHKEIEKFKCDVCNSKIWTKGLFEKTCGNSS